MKLFLISRCAVKLVPEKGGLRPIVHHGVSMFVATSAGEAEDAVMAELLTDKPKTDGWQIHGVLSGEVTRQKLFAYLHELELGDTT